MSLKNARPQTVRPTPRQCNNETQPEMFLYGKSYHAILWRFSFPCLCKFTHYKDGGDYLYYLLGTLSVNHKVIR